MPDDKLALIIDNNKQSALMIKDVLVSLNVKPVKMISTIEQAQQAILTQHLSIIITETQLGEDSAIELVNWLRKTNNINKTIPVIFMTKNATKNLVTLARDTGVTEFVIKPFTSATLSSAIISATKTPRNFIITRKYAGPDRRRKDITPPDGAEKRGSALIKQKEKENE